jgi:hypothetical protein
LAENDIIIRDVTDKIHQIPVHENNEFINKTKYILWFEKNGKQCTVIKKK